MNEQDFSGTANVHSCSQSLEVTLHSNEIARLNCLRRKIGLEMKTEVQPTHMRTRTHTHTHTHAHTHTHTHI